MAATHFNFIKTIGVLTVLTALSKIISLIRESAIASFYGASSSTDAYFVACGFVTNVFFGITAALAAVFVPYYINLKNTLPEKDKNQAVSTLLTTLLVFSGVIVIILFVFSQWIIHLIAPTYSGKTFQEAVLFLRIYSITVIFSMQTSMLTALLNAEHRFEFGAVASVVYSIVSITMMIALKDVIGVSALAASVPISFCIQLIILLFAMRRYCKLRLIFQLFNPDIKKLTILMFPVLLSNATIEINQLLTRMIASNLDEGAVSILSYSNNLFNFVSQLMVCTFITIYFTELSNAAKENGESRFINILSQAINLIVIVTLPLVAITFFFSNDIVSIAYGRGKFSVESIKLTASCLSIYAIVISFDSVRNLLIKAYYAKDNTKTPFINSLISTGITLAGSFILSKRMGVNGIIVSICISLFLTSIFLFLRAGKQIAVFEWKKFAVTFSKAGISFIITSIVLFFLDRMMSGRSVYLRFICASCIGFACYAALLFALKCEETSVFINILKHKKARGQN